MHRQLELVNSRVQRELQRRGIYVIRGLREIDVVVGVHFVVLAAVVAEQLERAIRDDLVGVHVRGGPRAALDHVHHEVLVVAAHPDLARRLDDGVAPLLVEQAQLQVRQRGGLLHGGQRAHECREFPQRYSGNREILQRAQRLNAVQRVVRYFALAQQIMLGAAPSPHEAKRTAASHERRVRRLEPPGDRARRAGDERGEQGGPVVQQRLHVQHVPVHDGRGLERARGGTVWLIGLEQHAFAQCLAHTQRGKPHGTAVGALFDRDTALFDQREQPSRVAFTKNGPVGIERCPVHHGGERIQIGVRKSVKELEVPERGMRSGGFHIPQKVHPDNDWRQRLAAGYSPAMSRWEVQLLCVALVAIDLVTRTWRIQWILRGMRFVVPFGEAFTLNVVGDTASAITPLRIGGEPARIAAMTHAKVPVAGGVVAILIEILVMWPVIIAAAGWLALIYAPTWWRESAPALGDSLRHGWPWFVGVLVLSVVAWLVSRRLFPRASSSMRRGTRRAWAFARRMPAWPLIASIPVTLISLAARVAILPVLALSLPDPPAMGPLFFASFTLLYSQLVLPTPSGVGAVDLGFLAGAAGDLGGHHTSMLLIWRFYTTFVPVALGIF